MLQRTEDPGTEEIFTRAITDAATDLRGGKISAREAIKRLGDAIEESFGPMDPLEVLRIAAEEMKESPNPALPDIFHKDGSVNETTLDERSRRIKLHQDC